MSELRIKHEWSSYDDALAEVGETTARVGIFLDSYCLTKNHDMFSKTVRDQIHVSLYPLAMWFASSWWRLHYEVLPDSARNAPSHDWRMSHEMASANMGFVWPQILFSPDSESVQVWARASQETKEESVRFLNGLDFPHSIPKGNFTQEVASLIEDVIARLHEVGCQNSDLAAIWGFICEDLNSPKELRKRRLEAVLGFDPESCPESLIQQAIDVEEKVGADSFSELSGAYALDAENRLKAIQSLIQAEGVEGTPDDMLHFNVEHRAREPWQIAVLAAKELRRKIGNTLGLIDSSTIHELLGLPATSFRDGIPGSSAKASVAGPIGRGKMKFLPRRTHPASQRFELARFIGDYVRETTRSPDSWLVSADLSTARQKFQRAFAAEFLCPIDSLVNYLSDDFSEAALEEAANHFVVSERTVESLLMNNGYLPRYAANYGMPYSVVA